MTLRSGNIGRAEQLLSVVAGMGLILASLRRGSALGRAVAGTAGMSLIARGASGYCAFRGAAAGQSSLREGFREQWNRVRSGIAAREVPPIDTLQSLYIAELQELHSAEAQLGRLLEELPTTLQNPAFARQMQGYGTEVQSRCEDLYRVLRSSGANPRQHSDQAMAALLFETRKVARFRTREVREAALLASLQRIVHFKIAGYGTVATYAKMLDRQDEAGRLSEYVDRDKEFDAELSRTAQSLVNPQAQADGTRGQSRAEAPASSAH